MMRPNDPPQVSAAEVASWTIGVGLAGSWAHGTAGAGSDVDVRGVVVAPRRMRRSLFSTFAQWEGPLTHDASDPLGALLAPSLSHELRAALAVKGEAVLMDLRKFLRLCAQQNPATLEVLFLPSTRWLFSTPPLERLIAARGLFLTSGVQETFHRYAMAQLKRLEAHRGRPSSSRNPARAALEVRFGYDTKHAVHLVRLLRMGIEVVRDGTLVVERPDASELRAIRDGAWSHARLRAEIDTLDATLQRVAATSPLPTEVDLEAVDALYGDIVDDVDRARRDGC